MLQLLTSLFIAALSIVVFVGIRSVNKNLYRDVPVGSLVLLVVAEADVWDLRAYVRESG